MVSSLSWLFRVYVTLYLVGTIESFYDVGFCTIALRDDKHACSNQNIYSVCKTECDNKQIECFSCPNVADPRHCSVKKTCNSSQVCVMAEFLGTHFQMQYNLGCTDKTKCSIFDGSANTGKRNSVHVAGYCCDYNGCNHHVKPGKSPVPVSSCEDTNPSGCQYVAKHRYNACSDPVVKQSLCRAMCGTCRDHLYCYDCQKLDNNGHCRNKSPCDNGTMCAISKLEEFNTNTFTIKTYFNMGCISPEVCSRLGGRNYMNCCNSSLCNNPFLLSPNVATAPSIIIPTTPTTPTTTVTTTPKTTVTTTPTTTTYTTSTTITTTVTYPQLSCDVDFIQIGGSCYYINPEGRTEKWEDAKVICMALSNSHLASFETESEVNEIKKHLQAKHGNDRHYSYWTGGMRVNQTNSWEWESSRTAFQTNNWYSPSKNIPGHDCLEYGPMYDYKWNDGNCDIKSNFICEM